MEESNGPSTTSKNDFSKILKVIGGHVGSVYVRPGNLDIIKTVTDNCNKLSSVRLFGNHIKPLNEPLPFRNLKDLQVCDVCLSTELWGNCFTNNPNIDNLVWRYSRCYNNCLPLLIMLPKLKSLTIYDLELNSGEFHHLSCLTNLTKFTFRSSKTCNQLLVELAEKLKLVELEFVMPYDADSFAKLILSLVGFQNLQFSQQCSKRSNSVVFIYCAAIFCQ